MEVCKKIVLYYAFLICWIGGLHISSVEPIDPNNYTYQPNTIPSPWYPKPPLLPVLSEKLENRAPITPEQLPDLRQRQRRVLVAITGVWDSNGHPSVGGARAGPDKVVYLKSLLNNYVHACEFGFEIHVVLVTYKVEFESLEIPAPNTLICDRLGISLPVAVARYPHERLPPQMHGSVGTLAQKHRMLFAQKLHAGYDLFISTEDDAAVKAHTIAYFLRWAGQTPKTSFYPGFLVYEMLSRYQNSTQLMSNPGPIALEGLHAVELVERDEHTWVKFCCHKQLVYMLTRDMLAEVLSTDWVHALPSLEKGSVEFNPYFTWRWLLEKYTVGIPLNDVIQALVHHMPDKYIKSLLDSKREDLRYFFNVFQWHQIVMMCMGEPVPHKANFVSLDFSFASAFKTNAPCRTCFSHGRNAYIIIRQPYDRNSYLHFSRADEAIQVDVWCK